MSLLENFRRYTGSGTGAIRRREACRARCVHALIAMLGARSGKVVAGKSTVCEVRDGLLMLANSTLDKLYADKMGLVGNHWSGKHHRTVKGINLLTLLWSDGESHIPCDYRLYDAEDGLSKNDHFLAMLVVAHQRDFAPEMVLFDSCYSSPANFKQIDSYGWSFLTQLKYSRVVNPNETELAALHTHVFRN